MGRHFDQNKKKVPSVVSAAEIRGREGEIEGERRVRGRERERERERGRVRGRERERDAASP